MPKALLLLGSLAHEGLGCTDIGPGCSGE